MENLSGSAMKIGICVPARDQVETGFSFDFAKLVGYDTFNRCAKFEGHSLHIYTMAGTLIFDQREKLAAEALKEGCDYIVFIDSDMRFPSDLIEVLLSRDVPIVGVNAVTRRHPVTPTAKVLTKEEVDGKTVYRWSNIDSRGKKGIEEVTSIGFGACMIKKEVFEALPRPWFDAGWGPTGVVGEDVHFCVKAGDHGFATHVDHELSMFIKHIGIHEYSWADFERLEE